LAMVTTEDYFERAKTFENTNDPEAANRWAHRALIVDPRNKNVMNFATRQAVSQGDKARTIKLSARVLAVDPGDMDNRIFLATNHFGVGTLDKADAILRDGVRLDATSPRLHFFLGLGARQAKQPDQHYIRHFKRAMILTPANGNIIHPVVLYCVHKARFEEMSKIALWRAILHRVKREFSALALSLVFVADGFIQTRRYEEGINWVNRFHAELESSNARDKVSMEIGLLYLKANRYDEATLLLGNLVENPDIAYRADYVAYFSILKYATGDWDAYHRLVNRNLI
jgi:tetratricopeptide (TPR) repeat protein